MTGSTTISVTLRGPLDAVLATTGPIDPDTAHRVRDLLAAVLAAGALHVIVDLSDAREVPGDLLDVLLATSWTVAERGGWLLVEGAEAVDPDTDLIDAFRAYRDTVAA